MVDKNDLGAELRADLGNETFLGNASIEGDLLNSVKDIGPALAKFESFFSSLGCLFFDGIHIILTKIFSNLVLLLETVDDGLLIGIASDNVGGSTQVVTEEGSLCLDGLVMLTINKVEELLS